MMTGYGARLLGLALLVLGMGSAAAQAPDCGLHPVMATHTMPPYPRDAVKKSVTGVTLLRVKIAPDGTAYAAVLEKSSGGAALDASAVEHIKAHWKWNAIACPRDRITRVSVRWAIRTPASYLWLGAGNVLLGLGMIAPSILLIRRASARTIRVAAGWVLLTAGGIALMTGILSFFFYVAGMKG